jgi:hypothetical protein
MRETAGQSDQLEIFEITEGLRPTKSSIPQKESGNGIRGTEGLRNEPAVTLTGIVIKRPPLAGAEIREDLSGMSAAERALYKKRKKALESYDPGGTEFNKADLEALQRLQTGQKS